ncbi:MAG: hypothetical protein E7317_10340, partial [Clostridiales bacterium]|nr:hypothetical protein [Clostridiales bacterium]
MLLTVVSLLIVLALVVLRGRLFCIRSIAVQGEGVVEEEVIRASGLTIGMPLSAISEDDVRTRIEATGQLRLERIASERSGAVV